ncbi:MAG: phosphonate ABC transporter ATP-binding protein [Spirochaetales bacterium]|nr:phosphonate ABC transporter ATP-binding protein [Spirochaetales bacterium]
MILEIKNLKKNYKDVCAVKNISLTVTQGEFISIIGPSGSGKTTLIRCVNRLIDATEGEIIFDHKNLLHLNNKELRQARAKIGMIFQHYNLVYRLSVIENVLHGRLGYKSSLRGLFGVYSDAEKEKAVEIIDMLGLNEMIYKRCDQLSGGQKQRVGIARALIQDPKIILCDEPISSLDPSSAKIIMDYLVRVQHDLGITIIVNLHQVDVAMKYADRILGIREGEIVFDGSPSELSKEKINEIYGTETGELILD